MQPQRSSDFNKPSFVSLHVLERITLLWCFLRFLQCANDSTSFPVMTTQEVFWLLFCSAHPANMCPSQLPLACFHLSLHHYHRHYHMPSHHVSRKTYSTLHPPYELICQEQDRSVPLSLCFLSSQLLKWEQQIRWVVGMRYHNTKSRFNLWWNF